MAGAAAEANIGTMPVPDKHRVDVDVLEAYLREHIPGLTGPLAVEQFRGGQSNPTFRVTADRRRFALRRKPPGRIFAEMNRVIAALHRVDYRAVGLDDYGRAGGYLERQIARWTKQYRASETEKIEAMERLIAWLPEHMPSDDETAIVHGDYRLDNLIFHASEPRIVAVLDWELSTLGHPLADFAYHCMSWRIPGGTFRGMRGLDLAALGIPAELDYVAAYCRRVERGPIDPDQWDFYIAYNMFRAAGIAQGIMRRALDGIATSAHAIEAGRSARDMAERGWQQVEKVLGRR